MSAEVQLLCDEDGLAIIGDSVAIEQFLSSEGLQSRELGMQRLRPLLGKASAVTETGSKVAAESGRWVKLTKESAAALGKFGLMKNSKTGLSMSVVQARDKVLETGSESVVSIKQLSTETFTRAKALSKKVSSTLTEQKLRRPKK